MFAPRTMARPRDRFSSVSTVWPLVVAPGAPPCFAFLFTLRNSSQSARTRFMCCDESASLARTRYIEDVCTLSKASICPTSCLPSFVVARIR